MDEIRDNYSDPISFGVFFIKNNNCLSDSATWYCSSDLEDEYVGIISKGESVPKNYYEIVNMVEVEGDLDRSQALFICTSTKLFNFEVSTRRAIPGSDTIHVNSIEDGRGASYDSPCTEFVMKKADSEGFARVPCDPNLLLTEMVPLIEKMPDGPEKARWHLIFQKVVRAKMEGISLLCWA